MIIFVNYGNSKANEIDIYDYDSVANLMKKNEVKGYTMYRSSDKEEEKEKTFEYDEYRIVFRQIEEKPREEVSIYPGSKIVIGSGGSSVGYRATRNGVKGIVISGHAGKAGNKVYFGGQLIGTIQISQNRGSIDAAFVRTNNNAILSNSVYNGVLSNNVQNLITLLPYGIYEVP